MNVFEMPPYTNFYPKSDTRRAMQYCRKTVLDAGGFKKPGVFPTPDLTTDLAWFLVALAAEGISLWALLGSTGLPLQYALSALGVAVILDLFFAYLHHRFSSGRVDVNEAKIALAAIEGGEYEGKDRNFIESEMAGLKAQNSWLQWASWVPVIVLLGLTGLKIFTYLGLHGFAIDVSALFIVACYMLVAFIHLRYSGYVLFTWPSVRLFAWTAGARWARDRRSFDPKSPQDFGANVPVRYTAEIGANLPTLKITRNAKPVHWVEVDQLESLRALQSAKVTDGAGDLDRLIVGLEGQSGEEAHDKEARNVLEEDARRVLQGHPNLRRLRLRSISILMDREVEALVNMVGLESRQALAVAGLAQQIRQLEI